MISILFVLLLTAVVVISEDPVKKSTCHPSTSAGNCTITFNEINQYYKLEYVMQTDDDGPETYSNIIFQQGILHYLPTNLFNIFSGATSLTVYEGQLLTLKPGWFQKAEKLEYLSVTKNNISELLDYTFMGADKINTVILSDNHIKLVGKLAFYNLEELHTLDLAANNLLALDFLDGLKTLKSLDLRANLITNVNSDMFSDLKVLEDLFLSNNCLKEFDFNATIPMTELKTIEMNDNYLANITAKEIKDNFPTITKMSVLNNNIDCTNLKVIENAVGSSTFQFNSEMGSNFEEMTHCNITHDLVEKCKDEIDVVEIDVVPTESYPNVKDKSGLFKIVLFNVESGDGAMTITTIPMVSLIIFTVLLINF